MSPLLVTSVIGLALLTVGLSQVSPSIIQAIDAKKVEVNISREEALMQQIIRYRALEGSYPANVAAMISAGYWRSADNDNGFGGAYSFAIDDGKGLIAITTTIADATKRAQYLNNYRHIFKPADMGSGVVTTTFVMPSAGALAGALNTNGSIPASSSAPSPVTNTYWYDTSGSTAKLMVSDGANWREASSGTSSGGGGLPVPETSNIVTGTGALPSTGTNGDVRYVYDAAGNELDTYVYYDGGWVQAGNGSGTPPLLDLLPLQTSLDFGAVILNQQSIGTLKILNQNAAPIPFVPTITSGSGNYSVVNDNCGGVVPGYSDCTITISFNPGVTPAQKTGTLKITF